jgi:flavin reductase (DIM6/NTAB) family NADH-FMN oxidoreductase RutF
MSHLAGSVFLITATTPAGQPSGLTVTSVTSHSDQPPTVSFNVALSSRSHDSIVTARALGVHLLAADQGGAAEVFSSRARDKFAAVDWQFDDGVPRVRGTLAFLRCDRAAVFGHGDHDIVLAEVRHASLGEGLPLLYSRRSFAWRLAAQDTSEP